MLKAILYFFGYVPVEDEKPVEDEGQEIVWADKWASGLFCPCDAQFAHVSPCPACGEFAEPMHRVFRRVLLRTIGKPWARRSRGYQFQDNEEVRSSVRGLRLMA